MIILAMLLLAEINPEKKALLAILTRLKENILKTDKSYFETRNEFYEGLSRYYKDPKTDPQIAQIARGTITLFGFLNNDATQAINARDLYAESLEKLVAEYEKYLGDLFEAGRKQIEEQKQQAKRHPQTIA